LLNNVASAHIDVHSRVGVEYTKDVKNGEDIIGPSGPVLEVEEQLFLDCSNQF